jgi:hypothetical protein
MTGPLTAFAQETNDRLRSAIALLRSANHRKKVVFLPLMSPDLRLNIDIHQLRVVNDRLNMLCRVWNMLWQRQSMPENRRSSLRRAPPSANGVAEER